MSHLRPAPHSSLVVYRQVENNCVFITPRETHITTGQRNLNFFSLAAKKKANIGLFR